MKKLFILICMLWLTQEGLALQPQDSLADLYKITLNQRIEETLAIQDLVEKQQKMNQVFEDHIQKIQNLEVVGSDSGGLLNIQKITFLWKCLKETEIDIPQKEAKLSQIIQRLEEEVQSILIQGTSLGELALSEGDRKLLEEVALFIQKANSENQLIQEDQREALVKQAGAPFKKDFISLSKVIAKNQSSDAESSEDVSSKISTQDLLVQSEFKSQSLFQDTSSLYLYVLLMRIQYIQKKDSLPKTTVADPSETDPSSTEKDDADDYANLETLKTKKAPWEPQTLSLLVANYIPFLEESAYEESLQTLLPSNNLVMTAYAKEKAREVMAESTESTMVQDLKKLSETLGQIPEQQKVEMSEFTKQGEKRVVSGEDIQIHVYWVDQLPTDLMHKISKGRIDVYVYSQLKPKFLNSNGTLNQTAEFLIEKEFSEGAFRYSHQEYQTSTPQLIDYEKGDYLVSDSRVTYEEDFLKSYLKSKLTTSLPQAQEFVRSLESIAEFYESFKDSSILSEQSAHAMAQFYRELHERLNQKFIAPYKTHLKSGVLNDFATQNQIEGITFSDIIKSSVQVSVSS